MICRSFEPVFDESARVLIVGSMPSVKSLEDAQYYAHPRNAFWPILFDVFGEAPSRDYERKKALIRAHHLALWDAAAVCEREGSLDTSIRHAVVNDFAQLLRECPGLRAIAHNGGESFKHSAAVRQQWSGAYPGAQVQSVRLPSTSPANASWSFERKQTAWAELMAAHGLL